MIRELRLRLSGVLFYFVFALNLASSEKGINFLFALPADPNKYALYQVVIAVVGLGTILFTSEAIGYVFSNLHLLWWNILRGRFKHEKAGYSAEWRKFGYDLKNTILTMYGRFENQVGDKCHEKFERQWENHSTDVFVSYFWQQAPKGIVDWAMRRHTAYFTGIATVIGQASGYFLSALIISRFHLNWTYLNVIIFIFTFFLSATIYWNAQHSRNEAWQIMDIYMARVLNKKLKQVLNEIDQKLRNERLANLVGQQQRGADGL